MKRFLVFATALSFFIFFCMDAQAFDNCGHKGCKPSQPKASAASFAAAFAAQSQWLQNQNSFSGAITGSNNTSFNAEAPKPDFLDVDAYQAAQPMDYRGPYEKTALADVMPWFDYGKWVPADFDDYPEGGKITCTGKRVKEADVTKYYYLKDGRTKPWPGQEYRMTTCICESETANDNPIVVWGKCGRELFKRGANLAIIKASTITFMGTWESDNVGATGGIGGFFGNLFGFNAQAGGNKAKGTAGPFEKLTLVVEGRRIH